MRIPASNANTSTHGLLATKKSPRFSEQNSVYENNLKDDTKQLKKVYHDFREFNPVNFVRTAYQFPKNLSSTSSIEDNSINLTPGTTLNLGNYSGQDVVLRIGNDSVGMSWGSSPIGNDDVKQFNDTLHRMLNGAVTETGAPDVSKLTKEQCAILSKMGHDSSKIVEQMGGIRQYEAIRHIGESFDLLIRVANGQMPMASLSPDNHVNIKAGLEKVGIDTSRPFYVNGQKFTLENGFLKLA